MVSDMSERVVEDKVVVNETPSLASQTFAY